MKRLLVTTCIVLNLIFPGIAQQNDLYITGQILDRETKEVIPYASISITNTTRGTAANKNGEFGLLIKNSELKESIKISSIGFKSRVLLLDSLKARLPVRIELTADIKVLNEVTINQSRINPVEIIKSAIDSVGKNYKMDAFNLEFYSQMIADNSLTNQNFKVESIILGYYMGYANSVDKKFEIVKKRAFGDNPLKASDYPFWPTLEIHRADLIASPDKTGILNEKNLDKFEFNYLGTLTYDNDTVYHIDYFAPKPSQKITGYGIVPKTYKGSIFITTTTHAIVKHEIVTDQFSYTIIYKYHEGDYFPYLISGERRLGGENLFSTVYNMVRLTNIELTNIKVIDYKTNEFQNLSDLPDDTEFWDSYYPADKK
jgi:hypothetical protein